MMRALLGMLPEAAPYLGIIVAGLIPLAIRDKNERFDKLMRNCRLINNDKEIPLIIDTKTDDNKVAYVLNIPSGFSVKDFEKEKAALSQGLGGTIDLQLAPNGKLILTVFKGVLGTMYPFKHITEIAGRPFNPVEFAVGYTQKGLLVINLLDVDPHMAIGGTTNSGKSVFLKVIITQAMLKPKDDLIISLMDLKRGVEFGIYEKSSRVEHYANDPGGVLEVLASLTEVMNDRLDLLAKHGDIENIKEYNKRFKTKKLPYHLLVIDEFTLLKRIDKAHDMVDILLCQARAVGIHVILSLQTHHSENLPGPIKTNLGTIVSFKMRNRRHSEILLESGDAADLRGKGHGLLLANGELTEFQGFYIDGDTIKELIKHTYIVKKAEEPELMGVIKSGTAKKGKGSA